MEFEKYADINGFPKLGHICQKSKQSKISNFIVIVLKKSIKKPGWLPIPADILMDMNDCMTNLQY